MSVGETAYETKKKWNLLQAAQGQFHSLALAKARLPNKEVLCKKDQKTKLIFYPEALPAFKQLMALLGHWDPLRGSITFHTNSQVKNESRPNQTDGESRFAGSKTNA